MMTFHCHCLLLGIAILLPSVSSQMDYCAAGTPVPIPSGCPSCNSRCGQISGHNNTLCSCDANCIVYGDCCEDFHQLCQKEVQEANAIDASLWNSETKCYDPLKGGKGTTVISSCLDGSVCEAKDNNQMDKLVPITDLDSGLHYKHAQCALCNKVQKGRLWNNNISCTNFVGEINSIKALNKLLKNNTCNIIVGDPPNDFKKRVCYVSTSSCSDKCNPKLKEKCMNGTQAFTSVMLTIYKNYYCALCSGMAGFYPNIECGTVNSIDPGLGVGPVAYGGSLTIIFDFNPNNGLQVGKEKKDCPPGEVWVADEQACHQKQCPPDYRRVGEECSPSNFNESIIASFIFNKSDDAAKVIQYLEDPANQWNKQISIKVGKSFNTKFPDNGTIAAESYIVSSYTAAINSTTILCVSLMDNSTFSSTSLNKLVKTVKDLITEEFRNILIQFNIDPETVQITFGNNSRTLPGTKLSCNWLIYDESLYTVNGSFLTVKGTGHTYDDDSFALLSSSAYVCVELSYIGSAVVYPENPKPLEVVELIFYILSILCLLIRIVLQFLFPYFRSFAGRLQFHLCLALCLAYLFMLIGGTLKGTSPNGPCFAIGILTYAMYLAAFGWMAAIAINTWIVFRPSSSFIKADDKSQSLRIYLLLGWALPIVLAVIALGLDFSQMDPRFKPTFASPLCWFNQRYSLLVFFGLPVGIALLINLVLFVMIICVLRKTFKEAVTSTGTSSNDRQHMGIYFRLFVLMGISWSLGFIAAFTGNLPVWIIFVILNASQGIFIFVSFVCRRPILKMIFKRWSTEDHSKSSSSSHHTKSSALSSGVDASHVSLKEKRSI